MKQGRFWTFSGIAFLLLGLIAGCTKAGVWDYNRGISQLEKGKLQQRRGNLEAAEDYYQQARKSFAQVTQANPQFGEAFFNLGISRENLANLYLQMAKGKGEEREKLETKAYNQYLAAVKAWQKAYHLFDRFKKIEKQIAEAKKKLGKVKSKSSSAGAMESRAKLEETLALLKTRLDTVGGFVALRKRPSDREALFSRTEKYIKGWKEISGSPKTSPNPYLVKALIRQGTIFQGMIEYAQALRMLGVNKGSAMEFFLTSKGLPSTPFKKLKKISQLLRKGSEANENFAEIQILSGVVEGYLSREYLQWTGQFPPVSQPSLVQMARKSLQKSSTEHRKRAVAAWNKAKEASFLILTDSKKIKDCRHQLGAIDRMWKELESLSHLEVERFESYSKVLRRQGVYIAGFDHFLDGVRALESQDFLQAKKSFGEALKEKPNFAEALYLKGCASLHLSMEAGQRKKKGDLIYHLNQAQSNFENILARNSRRSGRDWVLYHRPNQQRALGKSKKWIESIQGLKKEFQKEKKWSLVEKKLGEIFYVTW